MKLDNFIGMMTGHFDNKEQFEMMQKTGKIYPYAEHINTICNDKIKNIPVDFNGKFVVEESYYEINGKRHASPHLFLITETEDGISLSSYEIPAGEDKNTFSYNSMKNVDYAELKWKLTEKELLDMMNQLFISVHKQVELNDNYPFILLCFMLK